MPEGQKKFLCSSQSFVLSWIPELIRANMHLIIILLDYKEPDIACPVETPLPGRVMPF